MDTTLSTVTCSPELQRLRFISSTLRQHGRITEDDLAEMLVAVVLGGERIGGNNPGYDVRHPHLGRIEVRSRRLGTDGAQPRISLTRQKIGNFDHCVAVRFSEGYRFHDAVMLDQATAKSLYEKRAQRGAGLAHINWDDWCRAPGAVFIEVADPRPPQLTACRGADVDAAFCGVNHEAVRRRPMLWRHQGSLCTMQGRVGPAVARGLCIARIMTDSCISQGRRRQTDRQL